MECVITRPYKWPKIHGWLNGWFVFFTPKKKRVKLWDPNYKLVFGRSAVKVHLYYLLKKRVPQPTTHPPLTSSRHPPVIPNTEREDRCVWNPFKAKPQEMFGASNTDPHVQYLLELPPPRIPVTTRIMNHFKDRESQTLNLHLFSWNPWAWGFQPRVGSTGCPKPH